MDLRVTHTDPDQLDWPTIEAELDQQGVARLGQLLAPETCRDLIAAYDDEQRYRSRVVMARHGFGAGEYRYFRYPLPDVVATLRQALYPHALRTARRWADRLGDEAAFPDSLDRLTAECHAAGQTRPTPLILKYGPGDYNCLHQDLYGPLVFPLQIVMLLSPRTDYEGGEFVVTEQRPRMQSRAEVLSLDQGEAAIFAVRHRPRQSTKGWSRTTLRHGVSRLRSGQRYALGIIFHDAA